MSIALMEGSKDHHHHHILKDIYGSKSSLPDCSHACGPCFPCKRVIVSFKCSLAESCPIVYRCMCNGKYYHVPSNWSWEVRTLFLFWNILTTASCSFIVFLRTVFFLFFLFLLVVFFFFFFFLYHDLFESQKVLMPHCQMI